MLNPSLGLRYWTKDHDVNKLESMYAIRIKQRYTTNCNIAALENIFHIMYSSSNF